MTARYNLSQLIALGLAASLLLTVLLGGVSLYAVHTIQTELNGLQANFWEDRVDAEQLRASSRGEVQAFSAWLLLRDDRYKAEVTKLAEEVDHTYARIAADSPDAREAQALERIKADVAGLRGAMGEVQADAVRNAANTNGAFASTVMGAATTLDTDVRAFTKLEDDLLLDARQGASDTIHRVMLAIAFLVAAAVLLALGLGLVLTRSLRSQVGAATGNLGGAASELQAAANEQAAAAAEQATSINEVSSTMKELLASSQQITESARRVARIAEDTLGAVRVGELGVARTQEAMDQTRKQVDTVVAHMVDLGRKSQQIGGVLEIIRELAEQTNILAINATIEAAGAGEAGKRFAAVADEVRKLAERVTGSAREIRTLIDDVRASANTTLMATEAGSKAVDTGHRQVLELAASFGSIAGQVGTTSAAAREIELGTKQQATAVEQVTFAITDVAQAAKEGEASARQALETATNLAGVARDLTHLIGEDATTRR